MTSICQYCGSDIELTDDSDIELTDDYDADELGLDPEEEFDA